VPDLVDIVLGADALGYVEARPFRENEQQRTSTVRRRQQANKMPPKAAPAHPKYEDMVKAAILALKDRNGSSVPAIAKYLGSNFKLPGNFKKILSTQLKNLVKSGKLLKVKASYKLGEALKKAPKKPKKKAAPKKKKPKAKKAKKPKAKKAKKPKAKKAPKKKAAKKKAPKKKAAKKAKK
jgi:histone H1/5